MAQRALGIAQAATCILSYPRHPWDKSESLTWYTSFTGITLLASITTSRISPFYPQAGISYSEQDYFQKTRKSLFLVTHLPLLHAYAWLTQTMRLLQQVVTPIHSHVARFQRQISHHAPPQPQGQWAIESRGSYLQLFAIIWKTHQSFEIILLISWVFVIISNILWLFVIFICNNIYLWFFVILCWMVIFNLWIWMVWIIFYYLIFIA